MLFQKNSDHNLDVNVLFYDFYDVTTYKKNNFNDIFFTKLNSFTETTESDLFYNWLNDVYGEENIPINFEYLVHSEFKFFFSNSLVDVPRCFRFSKSLNRKTNKIPAVRFTNYLMRAGKRLQSCKFFLSILWNIFYLEKKSNCVYNTITTFSWKSIYMSLSSVSFSRNLLLYPTLFNIRDAFNVPISNFGKHIRSHWNIFKSLILNIKKLEPLFLFYVYKVDKNIYKNTRGKSGKYTFIWKYISQFKRRFLVMHWVMKELKMQTGRTLQDRLNSVLSVLYLSPEKTWMWKIRKFSYSYVYQNCRKTLAETYRTSTSPN